MNPYIALAVTLVAIAIIFTAPVVISDLRRRRN